MYNPKGDEAPSTTLVKNYKHLINGKQFFADNQTFNLDLFKQSHRGVPNRLARSEDYIKNITLPMTELDQIAFLNNTEDAKCVMRLQKDYTTHLYLAKKKYRKL